MNTDIQITFPGGKRVDAHYDTFHVETDQPPELGGEGAAPAPYDLFLASLATCAGIYVLGFCQARKLPTEGIRLVQKHELDPETHLVKGVRMELTLPPGFPEHYRAAIVRSALNCKVKKSIATPPSFDVVVVDEPNATDNLAH